MDAVARALCPTVHCFATPDLDAALRRNGLASLSQLVEPFVATLDQVQLRLPSTYEQRTARHFHLALVDRQLPDPASSSTATPHAAAATPSLLLNQPLALRDELFLDHLGQLVALTDPATAPPYPLVRDAVLARPPDDYCVPHESFAHPVACLVALSTAHPDPLNALAHLWDLSSPANLFAPDDPRAHYAAPDVLRFVVLVNDHGAPGATAAADQASDAHKLLDTVRKTYGNHSALVDLFSAADTAPDRRPSADEAEIRRLWVNVGEAQRQQVAAAARGPQDAVIGLGFDDERSLPQASAASALAPDRAPVVLGHELSTDDLGALRQLAREFVVQSLVPFLEQRAVVLYEQWQASRRGIGGRLFSVGRKYFGGGGGGSGASGSAGAREGGREGSGAGKQGYNAAKGYYHHSSPSALARRLADTAFFLGDYKLAYSVYDACAKDFRADKAARHAAAAMRMSAICAVLLLPPSPSPSSSASASGAPPPPQPIANPEALLASAAALSPLHGTLVDFDALRSTLVLVDLYAAHPHLAPLAPLALKSLSRRCLSQAAALYLPAPSSSSTSSTDASLPPPVTSLAPPTRPPPTDTPQWSAIRTHLHHALARQSYTVGAAQDSVDNFLALLGTGTSATTAASTSSLDDSAGAVGDGAMGDAPEWLDDFALAWDLLASSSSSSPATPPPHGPVSLPVRLFDAPHARLRVGSARQAGLSAGAGDEGEWARLEKALLARAEFDVGGGGGARPSVLGYRGGAGTGEGGFKGAGAGAAEPVEAVLGETLTLEVPVRNPLEAFLALGALAVEVRREEAGDAEGEEGGEGAGLEVSAPQDVELAPGESSKILIPIRASSLGTFTFDSLSYRFSNLVPVREPLSPARWSKPTAPRPGRPSARVAMPLRVRVRAAVPVLGVDMSALPSRLFHGEMSGDDESTTTIVLRNEGPVPLTDLHALSSQPDSLLLRPNPPSLDADGALATPNDLTAPRPTVLLEPGRALAPGDSLAVPVVVRGSRVGAHALCVLFAFRAADDEVTSAREYLSTRAVHGVEVYPSLELRYGVRPGRRVDSPFVLGVEVYNVGLPADDVSILAISLLSPRWRISPSADSGTFNDDVASQRIGWQQGLTTFVPLAAVVREGEGPSEEADLWTAAQVEALLDGKDVKGMPPHAKVGVSSLSPITSTSSSSISPSALSGLVAAYTSYRRASLLERYPTVPPSLHPSIFPLFSSRAASLVVTFTSSTLSLAPAHLLIPLDAPYLGSALGSPAAAALVRVLVNAERRSGGLYEESRRERRALLTVLKRSEIIGAAGTDEAPPVAVDVSVRGVVEHDFSSSGPLSLPLRLSLSNLSPSTTFSYTLSLSSPASRTGAGTILSGALTHSGTLEPLGRASVEAQLWVPRPGAFAVGAWEVVLSWEGRDEQELGGSVRLSGGAREVRVRDRGASAAGGSSRVALEEMARVQVRA
ncbi:uncharacterized protein RHOBADRAFT_50778 [Rhodotorula graminis WP1]|uniref:Uncharacterized protein n=1 Tax=Rhodotorula graminis (strain WP1) TaxID=578459 RepID=A0A194SCG6_RHOGW|nr:uncharacterized protein RHOBADRAFT_50778 [Rhodotorula graminis WP1]KPV78297.1 hypothetical protein RHOBADRAFT_50778 [Rhodotorula graminis WP1]